MCETRNETRGTARGPRAESSQRGARRPRRELGDSRDADWESRGAGARYRGGGPRTVQDEDGVEWMLVRKNTRQGNNRRSNRSRGNDEEA